MKDLNFFLPYISIKKTSEKTKFLLISLGAVIGTYILISNLWFFTSTMIIKSDIKTIKASISEKNIQEQYKNSQTTISKYKLLTQYNDGVDATYNNFISNDVVTSELIKTLFSTFPQDITISSLAIGDSSVQIVCISSGRISAAELEHNLLKIDGIIAVDIPGIDSDNTKNKHTFLIKCTLKGVDNNETK